MIRYNDFVIKFANVNGSGSASANGFARKVMIRYNDFVIEFANVNGSGSVSANGFARKS